MSFNIILQNNNSPVNAITKNLTTGVTLPGVLKDGTSIIDPVVMIDSTDALTGYNYAHIDAFGRYYFIKDIRSLYNNVWEVSLHVDVLMSYAAAIKASPAIIAKNQTRFNLYLNDNNYKCYQNPHIVTRAFPNSFDPSNFSFVLALCAGKESV